MDNRNVVEELVEVLEYYMGFYGLYNIDIKNLLKSSTDIVNDIKHAKNGPTVKKLDTIAGIFGLPYYQFGDPNFELPEKKDLPPATKERIDWRKEVGPPESKKYNKLDLNKAVLNALNAFADKEEFLPSDVFDTLSKDLKDKLGSATRVTGLFSDELKKNVVKTGNKVEKDGAGRKEEYYKVISLTDFQKK
ncbi:MAG: hypothetical protein EAS52_24275 [Parapedobacter sp.]|nr:MAG: hypothetical protein EAS52_24275 [Parapedobacter sp.]